jgi:hypothetical protein
MQQAEAVSCAGVAQHDFRHQFGPAIGRDRRSDDAVSRRDRLAEAVRRALPELIKLERYERRAAALRDRFLRPSIIE